jgi:hypothetical protein
MSDFRDAEEIIAIYEKQTENQIIDLNKIIVALRTKISYLEKEIDEKNKIPVPKTVVYQIIELENKIKKLEEELSYYKNYVPIQVIINRENKIKPTRKGGLK